MVSGVLDFLLVVSLSVAAPIIESLRRPSGKRSKDGLGTGLWTVYGGTILLTGIVIPGGTPPFTTFTCGLFSIGSNLDD